MIQTDNTGQKTILVVDDEDGPRQSVELALEGFFQVIPLRSGEEGLTWLEHETPDLVISDICMEGMSGIDFLREARRRHPDLPFIMLTGYGGLSSAQLAIRLGASDYLTKPFELEAFRARVREVLCEGEYQRRRQRAVEDLQRLNKSLRRELAVREIEETARTASAEFLHDLRSPLTMIMCYLDVLQEHLPSTSVGTTEADESMEALQNIERAVFQCNDLARMWQELTTPIDKLRQTVSVARVIDHCLSIFSPVAGMERIALEVEDAPDLPVDISISHFQRALHNLLSNAVHAVRERPNPRIKLNWQVDSTFLELHVCDNGCGIPQDQIETVFDPYVSSRLEDRTGTGLGLPICRKIIEALDGSLQLQSAVNVGTTVVVRLPRALDKRSSVIRDY